MDTADRYGLIVIGCIILVALLCLLNWRLGLIVGLVLLASQSALDRGPRFPWWWW